MHGVDAAIYSQIFMARTAVESAGHTFLVLAGISDSDKHNVETAKSALDDIVNALDNLNGLKKSK